MPKYAGTARTTSLAPLPGMQSHSHMDSVFQTINLLFPTRVQAHSTPCECVTTLGLACKAHLAQAATTLSASILGAHFPGAGVSWPQSIMISSSASGDEAG